MLRILIASSVCFLAACGSHPVDSAADKAEDTVNQLCDRCAEDFGMTPLSCRANFEPYLIDAEERACLKGVSERHESATPYFECVDDKASEYQSCIDSAGCNLAAIMNCGDILDSINDTCPLPSGDALAEIGAC
jgi:hypothetical protein